MDPSVLSIIGLIILFLLVFLRMPISFAMFIVGFFGILIMISPKAAFNVLTAGLWEEFSSYTLSVIPLYILMGEIIFRSGITQKMFDAAYRWVGHLKGGMAGTTILASAGFASICGSNSATAATMGTIALPELKRYRYKEELSTGSVATGGTLGIIIPPSTVLIVIALQTQQSVRDLFIASVIPAVILTVLLLLTIMYICLRHPEYGPAGERTGLGERIRSLLGVLPILFLFVFVIGGLYAGWFTPTESGAFGVFGAVLITLLMRKLNWETFRDSVAGALKSSAMVIMLIVAAVVFGRFLTITRLPYEVAGFVNDLPLPSVLIVSCVFLIYIIGGSIMDALGFLIISIPIFYPTVIQLGYDPVWFAVMLCIVTSLGAITPPVGVNVFVVKGLTPETPVTTIFRGAAYFLVTYVIFIAFLIAFPQVILFVL